MYKKKKITNFISDSKQVYKITICGFVADNVWDIPSDSLAKAKLPVCWL